MKRILQFRVGGPILLGVALATACAFLPARALSAATPRAGKVQITYDGKIGKGTAPGHARFVAKGAITDAGTVVIHGRDTGLIVYTKLTFTGKQGTFRVEEKIIKGGKHTWTLTSGTGAYAGLRGAGYETGAPDSTGGIHVSMFGTVSAKRFPTVYTISTGIPSKGKDGTFVLKGTLLAADGTSGTIVQVFTERRVVGGTVRCGGKTYHGPFTEDLKNPGHGTFTIAGWGTATYKTTRTIAVYPTAAAGSSPPLCALDTGSYRFVSGRLKGKHGTYSSPLDKLVLH
jgi:hypothetical protein